ncbi:MAG: PorV/PorQ family protein [Elusimicrobia bacterium]|nr:PorV/PorQ family protein [Elusimicrobiota bacterium]
MPYSSERGRACVRVTPARAASAAAQGSFYLLAALFIALAPAPARAQSGGVAGQFLSFGVGARAMAMGGAYYGISDDATAAYWNPAGLAQLQRKEITTMQASLFQQTKLTYFALGYPTKGGSTFALSMTELQSSGFEKVDAVFNPATGEAQSVTSSGNFNDQQRAIGLSWGKNVTETVLFGMTAKQITRQLAGSSDNTKSLDIGVMKTMGTSYRVGLGLQNAFSQTTGDTQDKYPVVLKLGNSLRLFKERLTLAADINKTLNSSFDLRFGGEYWISRWFAFRFGLLGLPSIQETDFGFGLNFNSFTIDIAQGIHDLGSSTRISATFRFGESRTNLTTTEVRAFVRQGMAAFRQGNFALAAQKFNQAQDAAPGNQQVATMIARLGNVTKYIPQATGGEEEQTFIRKGAIAYVDGRDLHLSVNALRYAFNKNPHDQRLLNFLNMVEKEAGVHDITRPLEGPEQFTLIDQKIFDARQAIYDGHYDDAVRRAQDVLDLEPNNVTALEVMGSAFFLMDQKDKAVAIWKRVLQLDPNNKAVLQFLQSVHQ